MSTSVGRNRSSAACPLESPAGARPRNGAAPGGAESPIGLTELIERLRASANVTQLRIAGSPDTSFLAASWLALGPHRLAVLDPAGATIVFFLDGTAARFEGGPTPSVAAAGSTALVGPGCCARWAADGPLRYLQVGLPPSTAGTKGDPVVLDCGSSQGLILRRLGLALADLLQQIEVFDAHEAWAWSTLIGGHLTKHRAAGIDRPRPPAAAAAERVEPGDTVPPGSFDANGVEAALRHIEAAVHHPLQIAGLARIAGMSRTRFLREFKTRVGTTPHRFIVLKRIATAQRLLESTRCSLTDAAYAAGFSSQSHMTSTFRRIVGTTPREYRAAARDGNGSERPRRPAVVREDGSLAPFDPTSPNDMRLDNT